MAAALCGPRQDGRAELAWLRASFASLDLRALVCASGFADNVPACAATAAAAAAAAVGAAVGAW